MAAFRLRADRELRGVLHGYASRIILRKYPNCIFREGQKPQGFYLIVRGSVNLYMEPVPGKKIAQRTAGEGCVVGLPATVSGQPYSLTCDVAEDTVELAHISRRDFSRLMTQDNAAAMKLLSLLSGEVQAARGEIARSARVTTPPAAVEN